MALEWDYNKNKINIEKHGIDFMDANKIERKIYNEQFKQN